MEGSEEPVMHWAVFTTLCSAFRSKTEHLPYHTVMQLVRMLSMVQQKKAHQNLGRQMDLRLFPQEEETLVSILDQV